MLESANVNQETYDAEAALADRLNKENVSPEDVNVEAGAHPEGRKRGGTVSVYVEGETRVFYDETACAWCGYDNLR